MCAEVKIAARSLKLGFLTTLIFILRWPDWQITSLFARGFKVAGLVEPSNVYPSITTAAAGSLESLLDPEDADKWNCSLKGDLRPSELDGSIYDTASEQSDRGILSKAMTKEEVDKLFGKGNWRGIRRRGINQNGKVRGIDNALTSKTNFAAWLQDTISTTPADIGIQILCWLFNGPDGITRRSTLGEIWVGLASDDLADAYHGVPNALRQLGLCVVALRNPHTNEMIFFVSYTHLFGLSAAVVNFNRLPELMTAVCRRIGACPTWHIFDDQGILDFAEGNVGEDGTLSKRPPSGECSSSRNRLTAPDFVSRTYDLVGRPFKPSKHQPAAQRQLHLGLTNVFERLHKNEILLEAKEGKLEELMKACEDILQRGRKKASLKEIMQLAGKLVFLTMNVFDKMARGGCNLSTLGWRTTLISPVACTPSTIFRPAWLWA